MEESSNTNRRALIVEEYLSCSYLVREFILPKYRCKSESYRHGGEAAQAIQKKHFPLIVLPVRIAPGINLENLEGIEEMKEIWNTNRGDQERYFEISLQLSRYARRDSSPNKNSLILYIDTFNRKGDNLISDVEKRVLDAQGDVYLETNDGFPREEIITLIKNKLGWS